MLIFFPLPIPDFRFWIRATRNHTIGVTDVCEGETRATRLYGGYGSYGDNNWRVGRWWSFLLSVVLTLMVTHTVTAQINYVPNPGFEDILDCDLEFGQADKAPPWMILNLPTATPDLYHGCSTSTFYDLPSGGCNEIFPNSGEGMVGLVNLNPGAEERIYARLIDTLPRDIDIYVAFSTIPRALCGGDTETLCYSNTPSMIFSDFAFQTEVAVITPNEIIDETENWTRLENCYRAGGTEDLVQIGNFRRFTDTQSFCTNSDPQNFSYYFFDDVIVSPFDVVPDTLYLCEGETLILDATFFEVPISWTDGINDPIRTIDQGGKYVVRGLLETCFMRDSTLVIEIPAGTEEITVDLCTGKSATLESPFPGTWENGDTNRIRTVTQPGVYTSTLLTPCGERVREYLVETTDCEIRYFVPNAFSPNNDGINDRLQFFFAADFEFSGTLHIFDRWGNQLFQADDVGPLTTVTWDGSFRNKPLGTGVVVWTYEYVSARDGQTRTVAGDVMVVK